jgi:hypothetical protein
LQTLLLLLLCSLLAIHLNLLTRAVLLLLPCRRFILLPTLVRLLLLLAI